MEVPSSSADDWQRLNQAWWDERAPVHAASGFYDVPGFLAGKDSLRAFEPGEVGDVRGKRLLHLMCHIGLDTLSWARRGAIVTGLDFSRPALDTAASLATRAGIGSARFVAAEIGDASGALAGETFDIVYTGTGVTQWIPDIGSWARTVATLVAPGGFFYIADYHPFPDSFDFVDGEVRGLRHGYLDHGPWVEQAAGSYTDPAETSANTFIKWNHHIGSVVNALAGTGLRIEFLHEYDFTDAPFGGLVRGEDGLWRVPADRYQIPLMFSLRAAKAGGPQRATELTLVRPCRFPFGIDRDGVSVDERRQVGFLDEEFCADALRRKLIRADQPPHGAEPDAQSCGYLASGEI